MSNACNKNVKKKLQKEKNRQKTEESFIAIIKSAAHLLRIFEYAFICSAVNTVIEMRVSLSEQGK